MSPVVIGIAALVILAGMGMAGSSAPRAGGVRSSGGGGGGRTGSGAPGRPGGTGTTRLPPGRPGKWFGWPELVRTRSSYDNTPTPQAASAMAALVGAVMDPLRQDLGRTIRVTSAYRSPEVNAATPGSSETSQHMSGEAIDFKVPAARLEDGTVLPAMGAEEVARRVLELGLPFDQLIWYAPGRGGHVHVSYSARHAPKYDKRWAPEGTDSEVPWVP